MSLKYIDTYDVLTTTFTGVASILNGVPNGTGPSDRIGRQIDVVRIETRLEIKPIISSTRPSVTRFMIILDVSANNTFILLSDIVETAMTAPYSLSPYRFDKREKYHVLFDKHYVVNGYNTATDTTVCDHVVIDLPKPVRVQFSATTGGYLSIRTNSLWTCFVSTDINYSTVVSYTRVYYTDV